MGRGSCLEGEEDGECGQAYDLRVSVHLSFWYFKKEVTIGVIPPTVVSYFKNIDPALSGSVLVDMAGCWVL